MLDSYMPHIHSFRGNAMPPFGLFDYQKQLALLEKAGDPLIALNKMIDWEQFRSIIDRAREKPRKSPAGAKGYDSILLFKILILQSLYNLSDEAMEFQILDRNSFSRFLGIRQGAKVPDATTIFRFRDELAKVGVIDFLFTRFDQFLHAKGFPAQKGQIVDASIVRVPTQRNTREENKGILRMENPYHPGPQQREGRKIPMPAGRKRTLNRSLATRTTSPLMSGINSFAATK
jgi:IS5 family transposase